MARQWKNGQDGTGKNGGIVQNCPIFLPFFSHFLSISNIFCTFPKIYFWQFLTIPQFYPFPPHFPSLFPFLPHFSIFPIFQRTCGWAANLAADNAEACDCCGKHIARVLWIPFMNSRKPGVDLKTPKGPRHNHIPAHPVARGKGHCASSHDKTTKTGNNVLVIAGFWHRVLSQATPSKTTKRCGKGII